MLTASRQESRQPGTLLYRNVCPGCQQDVSAGTQPPEPTQRWKEQTNSTKLFFDLYTVLWHMHTQAHTHIHIIITVIMNLEMPVMQLFL